MAVKHTKVRFELDVPGEAHRWSVTGLPLTTILRAMKAIRRKDEHLNEMIQILEREIEKEKVKC